MKIALKLSGTILILAANIIVLAQAGGTVVTDRSQNAVLAGSKKRPRDSDRLREEQLAVIKEHVLSRVLNNIKQMDEPGLRLSARNQILNYLVQTKFQSESNKFAAAKVAQDGLADLEDHGKEIPVSMAAFLIGDLGVWLEKHEPALFERFLTIKTATLAETDDVRSLLGLKDGSARAARRIYQKLAAGGDIEALAFYLGELQRRNYSDFEPLLARILELAERGPVPSLQTIDTAREIYLQSSVSTVLRRRFLVLVLARTQAAQFQENENNSRQIAFDLLTGSLPAIKQLLPNSYNKALTQAFVLRTSLTASQEAVDARRERLKSSVDAISDLREEAELTKSRSERNELLADAAQLTLQQNKITQALDIVDKLDFEGSLHDFWRGWADQFLKEVTGTALDAKDTQLAGKSVELISSPLAKVEALILIFQYEQRTGDETTAVNVFENATKAAGSDYDPWDKARAFLMLSVAANRTVSPRAGDLLESGIKALNSVEPPESGSTDRQRQERYVRSLGFASQSLTRSFKNLSKADENRALSLVEKLQKVDLRSFAMIGILQGLEQQ